MRLARRILMFTGAGTLIVAAYLAGAFTAALLAADTRAMAPKPVPVSIEIAERVAAL